jgi:hypothetical protein
MYPTGVKILFFISLRTYAKDISTIRKVCWFVGKNFPIEGTFRRVVPFKDEKTSFNGVI